MQRAAEGRSLLLRLGSSDQTPSGTWQGIQPPGRPHRFHS